MSDGWNRREHPSGKAHVWRPAGTRLRATVWREGRVWLWELRCFSRGRQIAGGEARAQWRAMKMVEEVYKIEAKL